MTAGTRESGPFYINCCSEMAGVSLWRAGPVFRLLALTRVRSKRLWTLWMICLSRSQLEEYVEEIRQLVFTPDSWKGQDSQKNFLHDKEFVSMCRFLQSGEIFLTLRHDVRHGDIGLIRRLVGPLSIWFMPLLSRNMEKRCSIWSGFYPMKFLTLSSNMPFLAQV